VDFRDGQGNVHDYTENLSQGGLFVRTERTFSVGERLPLAISFPGLLAPEELEVEVVRLRAEGPHGPAGVAVVVPEDATESRQKLWKLARAAEDRNAARKEFRLLLVEDNSLVAAMYTSALNRLSSSDGLGGLSIELATDGLGAIERLRRPPPIDIIVTDVYLPVMSGFALLEQVRATPELAQIPVVVITAGNGEERARAIQLGAELFLQKPVVCQDVVATIRSLLTARAAVKGGRASS